MKRGHCILAAGLCILAGLVSGCGDKKQQTSEEITTAEDGTVAMIRLHWYIMDMIRKFME